MSTICETIEEITADDNNHEQIISPRSSAGSFRSSAGSLRSMQLTQLQSQLHSESLSDFIINSWLTSPVARVTVCNVPRSDNLQQVTRKR